MIVYYYFGIMLQCEWNMICNLIMFGFHEKVLDTGYRVCSVLYASSRFLLQFILNWMVLDAPGFSYKICAYKILCAKIFIYDFFACVIFIVWKYVFCDNHSGEHFCFVISGYYCFTIWCHCSGHYLARFLKLNFGQL